MIKTTLVYHLNFWDGGGGGGGMEVSPILLMESCFDMIYSGLPGFLGPQPMKIDKTNIINSNLIPFFIRCSFKIAYNAFYPQFAYISPNAYVDSTRVAYISGIGSKSAMRILVIG
jgi:hypothetical protein